MLRRLTYVIAIAAAAAVIVLIPGWTRASHGATSGAGSNAVAAAKLRPVAATYGECTAAQLTVVGSFAAPGFGTLGTQAWFEAIRVSDSGGPCTLVVPRHLRITTEAGSQASLPLLTGHKLRYRLLHGARRYITFGDWWPWSPAGSRLPSYLRRRLRCRHPVLDVTAVTMRDGPEEVSTSLGHSWAEACPSPTSVDVQVSRKRP